MGKVNKWVRCPNLLSACASAYPPRACTMLRTVRICGPSLAA